MREDHARIKHRVLNAIRKQNASSYCYETAKDGDPDKFPPCYNLNITGYDRLLVINSFEDEENYPWKPRWPDNKKKSIAPGCREWSCFTVLGYKVATKKWSVVPPSSSEIFKRENSWWLFYGCYYTEFDFSETHEPALVMHCFTDPVIPERGIQHFLVLIPVRMLCYCLVGISYRDQIT